MIKAEEAQCLSTLSYFGRVLPPRSSSATRQDEINSFFKVYGSALKVFASCAGELEPKRRAQRPARTNNSVNGIQIVFSFVILL